MPTIKRKSTSEINNKVYASVRLRSTTNTIDIAVEHVKQTVRKLSSSNKKNGVDTKSIIRSIQNDLLTISGCNTILESEIASSLSSTSSR